MDSTDRAISRILEGATNAAQPVSGGQEAEEAKMKENDQKMMNINFKMDSNQRREAYNSQTSLNAHMNVVSGNDDSHHQGLPPASNNAKNQYSGMHEYE